MSDPVLITAKLKEVRRRQFHSLLAGSAGVLLLGIADLVLLFTFTGLSFPMRPVTAVIALSGAALAGALGLSILRMPSWKATARLIDRSMGLEQRVETAWERLDGSDEIDLLLLRDASRSILVNPSKVVSLRFDRAAAVGLLIGVVALTGLGILRILGGRQVFLTGKTAQVSTSAASRADSARTSTMSKRQLENPTQASAVPNANPEPGRPSTANQAPQVRKNAEAVSFPGRSAAVSRPDMGAGADPIKPSATSTTPKTGAALDSIGQPGERPTEPSASKPAPERSPASRQASTFSPSRSDAGTASIRAAERKGGTGSSSQVGRGVESSSGGALSGREVAVTPSPRALSKDDAAFLARYSRNYPAFRQAAEQARARDKIPPGLRKYIANYFQAIQK